MRSVTLYLLYIQSEHIPLADKHIFDDEKKAVKLGFVLHPNVVTDRAD